MQGADYIFCLQSKNFAFWKPDNSGSVTLNNQPYFLDFSPSGWEDVQISNIRNKKYWGIDRTVTVPLAYVNDGAKILKHIFYTKGIEEPVYLVIASQQLDYNTPPAGGITVVSGGNLNAGSNSGTISGVPGSTVYAKLTGSSSVYTTGYIGTTLINGIGTVFPIVIPSTGSIDYYIFSAGDGQQLVLVNQAGNTTASYGYWYKQIFRGEVDLSTFIHNGSKITCTTLEDGLPKFLKANENTTYEFPMNDSNAIDITMDGINLREKLNYQEINDLEIHFNVYGDNFLMPTIFLSSEGNSVGVQREAQTIQSTSSLTWDDKLKVENFLIRNVGLNPVTVTITGKIEFTCVAMVSSPPYAVRFRFIRSHQLIGGQNDYQIYSTGLTVGQTYTHDYSITIPLEVSEKLFFEGIYFGGSGTDAAIQLTENSKSDFKFITRQPTTVIKGFRPQYIFSQLVPKFTEGNYTASISSYFEKYKNIVFTCGNAIRGLSDAVMKISFADFFQFWDCFDSVGISEKNNVVNFDSKPNLVDLTDIIDLVEPSNLKVSVAREYLYNELAIGYTEIKNDVGVLNGNEEYNCGYLFSIGTTKSPAKIDKISRAKASPYEIELTRVTTFQKDTTDHKNDNDLFLLAIEGTASPFNLDRSLNASATGLLEKDTVFNLPLTPKRMILNNGPFLRSSLYLCDNKILSYKSADKNNKLIAGGIVEKADVPIGSLGEKFFYPVMVDMDVPPPENLLDLLNKNPLSVFKFPFYGDYYYGLLVKASIAPASHKEQSYQLMLIPPSNLAKLIYYYG